MLRTLVKTDAFEVGGQIVVVRYFELRTARGIRRYSAELMLSVADCVILDDDSLETLEARALRIVPATCYSRALFAGPTAA
jgi:hypothetical protein